MTTTLPPPTPSGFPPPDHRRRRPIVLVHGAWVGEWCWDPVLDRLLASGRSVHAVSLTGHGARRHQGGPQVTLGDHVEDLVGLLDAHDLEEATVVAHSYGGRVVTRAWPRIAARTARLVYLDAHAPLGPVAADDEPAAGRVDPATGLVPFAGFDPDPATVGGEAGLAWFRARLVPQSLATLTEPFRVDLPDDLDKTYVHATGETGSPFAAYAAAAAASPHWRYRELPGSHWLMATHPDAVARTILDPDAPEPDDQEDPR